ncbi:amidase [Sporormia fimetaria CBS 119925]|uniref:amidase n=1 Tax=Sporormia fimetaria CBS 119925 TaxID=1340428 RepID=A0A6A6V5R6_9PLEO|nr:amidase [Sporormia fimetaria CBS 119925]
MTQTWQERAEAKRSSIIALIPPEWRITDPPNDQQLDVTGSYIQQFLSDNEIQITESTAEQILKNTHSGRWTAEEVTRAFCHRAALAHQLTNCLHEIFFDAAIASAKELDEHYAKNKQPLGPLHGLPVSLKDQFHVKDVETSMGYIGWLGTFEGRKNTGKERVYESELVRDLRATGAVLFCKTSVPHTLMSGETVNNIISYTWNPKNRALSSGGSSGGEGALIGLRGSVVGFGTDIGGSIRIPAAFNGVFGLKPSTGRLPYEGMANSMDGQNSILSVLGPLASSIEGLRVVTKAVLGRKPWLRDPLVVEMPWREEPEEEKGKMAFGVLRSDGTVNPQPPVRRAVEMVVKALKAQGHEVIDWTPPSHKTIMDETLKTWAFDGGADVKGAFALSGEPMAEQVKLFGALEKEFTGSEMAAVNVRLRQLKKEYMEYWNSTDKVTGTGRPVDAVIMPVAPFPAARPNGYLYYGYTGVVNALDYTSVVVPITNVDSSVDKVDEGYQAIDELDKAVHASYDPQIYHYAHVGVQLVGRRLQEERMLAIAEYVNKVLEKSS